MLVKLILTLHILTTYYIALFTYTESKALFIILII